jgi:ATP-dependent DNA helicase RecQ
MGIPVHPEIKKLKIGWAAKAFNFNGKVNDFIKTSIRSGDQIFIKQRTVPYNGTTFTIHEMFKDNSTRSIGELSSNADFAKNHSSITGFIVNEVVVWTFEDTQKFDEAHNTNYSKDWCNEARNQGFIYLVDFAGYGTPAN